MNDIGVVAIGRNEGERLHACVASALRFGCPTVYVDSGSTDGSVAHAHEQGVEVVELDTSMGFSAARARNAGYERLREAWPQLKWVMFVDGDCEIVEGWFDAARATMQQHDKAAVVAGRRRERRGDTSIYNRLIDLEWDTPIGQAESIGGDALFRIDAFEQVEGFNPSVKAGEEPELCKRLRDQGWQVYRIDSEMTLHDAAIHSFGQWWRRSVRTGYGGRDVATRFGLEVFARINRSARRWAIGLPMVLIIAIAIGATILGWLGAAIGLLVGLALPALQVLKLTRYGLQRGLSFTDGLAFGVITLASKAAQTLGQWRHRRDQRANREAQLIEYKDAATEGRA